MGQAATTNRRQFGTRDGARWLTEVCSEYVAATHSGALHSAATSASSREVVMRTRFLVVTMISVALFSIFWAGQATGGEPLDAVAAAPVSPKMDSTSTDVPGSVEPWIHPSMPSALDKKLRVGFEIAIQRVTEVPSCNDLFAKLHADPVETLKTGLYFPASPARETSVCRRSMAQTFVGDAPTWICRRMMSSSDEHAAMVIIHEALHHAGLTEKPRDRKAMSSGAINVMVGKSCNL
jgi:hypothetical protein